MATLRRANRPALDAEGYAHGIVVKSDQGVGIAQHKGARDDVDEQTYDRFELTIQADGTVKPVEMRVFLGTVLNPDPINQKGRGKKVVNVYNRFTTVALSLGLVTEKELATLTDKTVEKVEKAFLNLEGEKVRFRVGLQNGLYVPDPSPSSMPVTFLSTPKTW